MNIILDFDNTMVNSNQAILDIASKRDNKQYNVKDITDYSFSNILTDWTKEDIDKLFVSQEFYDTVKPFKHAVEVIERLSKIHTISVCSITREEGLTMKAKYIREVFGDSISKKILIDSFSLNKNNDVIMDKGEITCSLVLDDHIGNLNSIDAPFKICFGDYAYNKDNWTGDRVNDWLEFEKMVLKIEKELGLFS